VLLRRGGLCCYVCCGVRGEWLDGLGTVAGLTVGVLDRVGPLDPRCWTVGVGPLDPRCWTVGVGPLDPRCWTVGVGPLDPRCWTVWGRWTHEPRTDAVDSESTETDEPLTHAARMPDTTRRSKRSALNRI
jgi:hypothetical protein